jgi:hypothetical protein
MSEVERRDVLIASVGLATAALAAASPAQAGDASFMNNVPRSAPVGRRAADIQIRPGEIRRQSHRQ